MARLRRFETLITRWNRTINVVGQLELQQLWQRHIADSLALVEALPPHGEVVDLGSGAGFPGLVVAIASTRPVILVEANRRKAAFLRECTRELGVAARVVAERIERCGIVGARIVTARALARLPRLLALATPMLAEEGACFFIKGAQVEVELTEARRDWQMSVTRHASSPGSDGCIIEVRHLRRVEPA